MFARTNFLTGGSVSFISHGPFRQNFPYLIDDTQTVARAYGAVCTPDPFLFDHQRRLIYHGKINDANEPEAIPKIPIMENNIRKALAGRTIEKDFDPSIGFPSIQFLV